MTKPKGLPCCVCAKTTINLCIFCYRVVCMKCICPCAKKCKALYGDFPKLQH